MGFKGVYITRTCLHDAGTIIFCHVNYALREIGSAGPKGGLRGTCPRRGRECPKKHFCHVLLKENVKERRKSCDLGLQIMGFKIPYCRVAEDTTIPVPSQTKLGNRGGGHLSPVPRLWGWNVAKMSQICPLFNSVVACIANPMQSGREANSCGTAVPPPRPDSEIKKRAPVPRVAVLTVWLSCPNCCAPSSPFLPLQMCII